MSELFNYVFGYICGVSTLSAVVWEGVIELDKLFVIVMFALSAIATTVFVYNNV